MRAELLGSMTRLEPVGRTIVAHRGPRGDDGSHANRALVQQLCESKTEPWLCSLRISYCDMATDTFEVRAWFECGAVDVAVRLSIDFSVSLG